MSEIYPDRHPATVHLAAHLSWPVSSETEDDPVDSIGRSVHNLASALIALLGDGPELSDGLRSLLHARDAFMRQLGDDSKTSSRS